MTWRALKRFCEEPAQYGLNVASSDYVESGMRFIRTTDIASDGGLTPEDSAVFVDAALVGSEHELVEGDVLFSRSGTLGRCLRYRDKLGPATFAGYLVRFRPGVDTDPRYIAYCAEARFFHDAIGADAVSSTIANFNAERYSGLSLPWWPTERQRAIADYLDAETARIDALIAKKRRLVELLDERLSAEIRWNLGACSAPRLPIKRRWRVIDCKHRTPTYVDEGFPVVSPGDATPGRLDLRRAHRFVEESDFLDLTEGPRRPRRGDVIYSRNASIGIASFVDTDEPFCMGQDVCLITSRDQDQLFLTYALNTLGLDQLDREKIGSTFSRINVAQIIEITVPCPEPEQQRELSRPFDEMALRRDATVRLFTQQLDLLVEHRQALIAAAVTGELEIPGVAA